MSITVLNFDPSEVDAIEAGIEKFSRVYNDPWGLAVYSDGMSVVASYPGGNDDVLNARITGWFLCYKLVYEEGRDE